MLNACDCDEIDLGYIQHDKSIFHFSKQQNHNKGQQMHSNNVGWVLGKSLVLRLHIHAHHQFLTNLTPASYRIVSEIKLSNL